MLNSQKDYEKLSKSTKGVASISASDTSRNISKALPFSNN
jgi:hypothetical protein